MPRRTHRPLTVIALLLSIFMAAVEMTVVSTAMPTVVAELKGALHYAWVFSAYMLTSTVTVPIYGKLADLYGRKPVLHVAMVLFLVGSIACGQAHSMGFLIAARALQGIGAGGLQPIAITVIGDIFDLEERSKMQGIFGAVWGIAGLAGPLIGGLIVASWSWRWVFYINVPFGLLSGLVLWFALHETIEKKDHTFDIAGAICLSTAVIALLVGVEGFLSWVLVPVSVVAAIAFLFVELRAKEPMLPPPLFKRRMLAITSVLATLAGAALIGITTFIPLYVQGVLGASPTVTAATIAPMAVSWPIASAIAGRLIPRLGYRILVRSGFTVVAASTLAFLLLIGRHPSAGDLRLAGIAFGLGMGMALTPVTIAVQTSVSFAERGVATASTMFFRSIGGTIGVGVMGVVLARDLLANAITREAGGSDLIAKILGPDRRQVSADILGAIAGDLHVGVFHIACIWVALGAMAVAAAFAFPRSEARSA
jgi:EmrB/QacA subfamily drug resistance transporter